MILSIRNYVDGEHVYTTWWTNLLRESDFNDAVATYEIATYGGKWQGKYRIKFSDEDKMLLFLLKWS